MATKSKSNIYMECELLCSTLQENMNTYFNGLQPSTQNDKKDYDPRMHAIAKTKLQELLWAVRCSVAGDYDLKDKYQQELEKEKKDEA
jgi:hypothetical protein